MSDELTARQEAFARNLARGSSQRAAYLKAGYACSPKSADEASSRLSRKIKVQRRVKQIAEPVAKKAGMQLAALVERIEAAIRAAQVDGAHSAVISGNALIFRIIELVREDDRANELQFAGAADSATIMALIRDLVGDVVAAIVEAAVVSDVYSSDIDKALELIDGIRADLLARTSDKAVLVS
jgi:hypothetical protein